MRDPKRIKKILRLIRKIWLKSPDLRLMQLLGNCFEAGDNYYKEDEELGQRLREVYLNAKPYSPEQLKTLMAAFERRIKELEK